MKTTKLLLPLAIAAVIGLGACAQDGDYDSTADTAADTAEQDTAPDMSADPSLQTPATEPAPIDDTATMADAGAMPAPAPDLIALDVNNDGSLTLDELPANDPWRNQFASADTDGDGMLSQTEIDAHAAEATPPPPTTQ